MHELYTVSVSPDAYEFNLALKDKWAKVAGHLLKINEFKFSAVPIKNTIRISEVRSGAKLIDVRVPDNIQSYEDTMMFLELNVVPRLVMIIKKIGSEKFNNQVNEFREIAIKNLGKKPATKKLDTNWLKEDKSGVLH
ncbi:hypothetical protein J1P26_21920 [Neobacillus sp. MM2021_6]|uniref:hypothetical protein n=1 Tax=Bacillaceae TaxID=186817 RepID=UPI0014097884|nr:MULTISPECIES: hypothetical protein [Bacillaceae]MBO0962365.1 hypothetical protein [Neobacillus sp. MM2021_6]NHC20848.1 hypothetical protein [Bacillus sp. MM2020_4]